MGEITRRITRKALVVMAGLALAIGLLPAQAIAASEDGQPWQLMAGESISSYPLWIAGTQVTSENADNLGDIPGVKLGEGGYVKFTPAEGETPATLLLNNATIEYSGTGDEGDGICYKGDKDFVIKVSGTCAITDKGTWSKRTFGICITKDDASSNYDASLIIAQGASLTVEAGSPTSSLGSEASIAIAYFRVFRGFTIINNGSLSASSAVAATSSGINSHGTLLIDGNGKTDATGGTASAESFGIYAYGVTIEGGTINASAGELTDDFATSNGIYSNSIAPKINGGTVTACTTSVKGIAAYAINRQPELGEGVVAQISVDVKDGNPVEPVAYETGNVFGYKWFKTTHVPKETLTVVWLDGDGSVLQSREYVEGDPVPAYEGKEPTKAATAQYTYKFSGWDGGTMSGTTTTYRPLFTEKPVSKSVPAPVAKKYAQPMAKIAAKGKRGLTITWSGVDGADGYDVFLSLCDYGDKKFTMKRAATVKAGGKLSWSKSGLKAKKCYKARVKAYVMRDGQKSYVSSSSVVHAYTSGGTKVRTNAKGVTVGKKKMSLKVGEALSLKVRVVKLDKSRKLIPASHVAKVRYLSTDTSVATVSAKGKVKARGKGTCYVYAYAHNGAHKKVRVTVG